MKEEKHNIFFRNSCTVQEICACIFTIFGNQKLAAVSVLQQDF